MRLIQSLMGIYDEPYYIVDEWYHWDYFHNIRAKASYWYTSTYSIGYNDWEEVE